MEIASVGVWKADTVTVLHICAPLPIDRRFVRNQCPTCDRKTFFLFYYYEWYGASSVCLRCGERWNDGEMEERPFLRGWRTKSIEQAKRRWRAEQETTESQKGDDDATAANLQGAGGDPAVDRSRHADRGQGAAEGY